MCYLNILPSIARVLVFVIFLVLACSGRTIEECGDFLQVKVWRYRRQLLIHHSNIWVREVAAWESENSFAYVLREATDGDWSYGAIYDEHMTLRSCKVIDGYTEEGNTQLISDLREQYRRNETKIIQGESTIISTTLETNFHSATTFDEIVNMLNDKNVTHTQRLWGHQHRRHYNDHIRVSDKPSEGDDGPSVEIYRNLPSDVPDVLVPFVDLKNALDQCNEINTHIYDYDMVQTRARWLPNTIITGLETIGILDPVEEDDDVINEDDDFAFAESEEVEHHNRQKRGLFMFPGTLWCGTGNRAPSHDSLGIYNKTDMCCREHDMSPSEDHFIVSGESKYHLRNWGMVTLTHCSLDKRFHKCLRQVRTTAAYEVGRGYFNVFNVQCFVVRNRKQCLESYWYMPWRCKTHKYMPTACLRNAQVFPSVRYQWPS